MQFNLHSFEFSTASGQTNGREKSPSARPVSVRVNLDGASSDDSIQVDWMLEKKRQVHAYFRDLRIAEDKDNRALWARILSEGKFSVDSSELSTRKRLARTIVRTETNEQRIDRLIDEGTTAGFVGAELADFIEAEMTLGVTERLAALRAMPPQ